MAERDKGRFTPPAVGGSSLLVVFAVLCLTVFALLSLSTVRADLRLGDASAQAVAHYYAADRAAQETLARLRAGELPQGVTAAGDTYSYTCPISDTQELAVTVTVAGEEWQVLTWQAVPTGSWQAEDALELWDGGSPF